MNEPSDRLMQTLLEILKKTTDFFAAKGIEHPRLDAELLVGHALGLKRMQLYLQFERLLSEPELERIRPLVRRRAQREPWQYIVGEVEWSGLKLKVDRRGLIPRPETELLIEETVKRLAAPPARILDLGTGSGALALALASRYASAEVTGVDASAQALALARENAEALGLGRVRWVESNWYDGLDHAERFDLIVANPPYLGRAEVAAAQPEVRGYEPESALVAEEDGLADLRVIINGAREFLVAGGLLVLETGIHQHPALLECCRTAGFATIHSAQDLTGRDRYIFATSV